jgi:hypothetical protein
VSGCSGLDLSPKSDLGRSHANPAAAQHTVFTNPIQVVDFIDCSQLLRNRAGGQVSSGINGLAFLWAGSPQSYAQVGWKVRKCM